MPSFFTESRGSGGKQMERVILEKWYWETFDGRNGGNARDGVFERYYDHLQRALLRGLNDLESTREAAMPELSEELTEAYLGQMKRITLRALLLEMEICEEEGSLKGVNGQEKYACFEESFLGNPEYLREVYDAYPLMYEGMLRTLGDFVRNIEEVLKRFAEDREGINSRFFQENPCRNIRRIGGGGSDAHRQGRRVFILEMDNGEKLVYKPRSLAIDERYTAFLGWIFRGLGMPFWWNCAWDRGNYGWCQWVSGSACRSREELQRYYYRNGILLCVSYLLGSEDIHYENLIACGEYPVIVDLEMIVGSRGMGQEREMGHTERFYRESVLQTGLLPLYAWNRDGEGVNVSAINGKGGQLAPVEVPVVAEPGTIKMHIEYRRPATREGKNLATLEGKFIEPAEFLEEIKRGFGDAYAFLAGRKEEVREQLRQFRDVEARYVVRDTQKYFMLLQALGHPDMQTGEEGRELVWDVLEEGTGEAGEWVKEQEKQELMRGDVPIFSYRPGGLQMYSGTGECLETYFAYPMMKYIERRLDRMGAEDLERQQKLIRSALLMGVKRDTEQGCPWAAEVMETASDGWRNEKREEGAAVEGWRNGRQEEEAAVKRWRSEWQEAEDIRIRVAERIGDILLENAIWSEDGKEVGWITMTAAGFRERSCLIRPMDCSLYGGLAGIALFMAELSRKTEKEGYERLRKVLVDMLFRHTDELFRKEETGRLLTGAYTGEASLAFAYMMLYEICGNSIFLEYLRKQCRVTAEGLAGDREYDVLGGNAGAILVFLKAYGLTGENCYLVWAREAGDWLLWAAVDYGYGSGWVNRSAGVALTGFAHGTAGIMLALVRLGYDTGEKKYWEAAYRAYRYEEHYYREELLDWEDLRGGEGKLQESPEMAWCHGWGGIVLARMEAMKYVEGDFREELGRIQGFAEEKLMAEGSGYKVYLKKSFCLCHGICGNLALMAGMGKMAEEIWHFKYLVMKAIEDGEKDVGGTWAKAEESGDYGLMGGLAGVGYSCLCGEGKILRVLRVSW